MLGKLLFLLSSVCAMSGAQAQKNNSLLWEISGNGLARSSYIYGTFHLIDAAHFTVRPEIDSVFNLTEQVAFEIKMDDMTMMNTIQSWMPLPAGKTLADYCTPEEYAQLSAWVSSSLHMDMAMFAGTKPFGLYQSFITSFIEGEMASYEGYFLTKSITGGKPVFGLETLQQQLAIFDSITYEEQIDWMISGMDSTAGYDQVWDKMIRLHQAEDIQALYAYTVNESPELSNHKQLMLTDRNIRWIPTITTLATEKPTFVAVGAAHLGGPQGVIQLLIDAGYTVKPI